MTEDFGLDFSEKLYFKSQQEHTGNSGRKLDKTVLAGQWIMRKTIKNWNGQINFGGTKICNLRYEDDTT